MAAAAAAVAKPAKASADSKDGASAAPPPPLLPNGLPVITPVSLGLIDYYFRHKYFARAVKVCDDSIAKLQKKPSADPNEPSTLAFWKAIALASQGMDADAVKELDALRAAISAHNLTPTGATASGARDLLTLPIVVALIGSHSRAPAAGADAQKQKKIKILALKKELKACAKTSTDIGMTLAGRYFFHTGKIAKARQCIERVVAKCRASVVLLSTLGWIYINSGISKYELKASSVFKKALKLCPAPAAKYADISALMGRALCAERERKFEEALNTIKQIATIYPSFAVAHAERVRLSFCAGKWDDALHAASRLSKRDPDSLEGYKVLLMDALLRQPNAAAAAPATATAGAGSGGPAAALTIATIALAKTEPASAALNVELGQLASRCAKRHPTLLSACMQLIDRAMALSPDVPFVLSESAHHWFLLDEPDKAFKLFEKVTKSKAFLAGTDDWCVPAIGKVRCLIAQREWNDAQTELNSLLAAIKNSEQTAEKKAAAAAAGAGAKEAEDKDDDAEEKVVLNPPPAHHKAQVLHLRALLAWNKDKDRSAAVLLLTECLQLHQSALADRAPDYDYYVRCDPDWLLFDLLATAYPILFVHHPDSGTAAASAMPASGALRTLYLHVVESLLQLQRVATGWTEVGVALARCHWAADDQKAMNACVAECEKLDAKNDAFAKFLTEMKSKTPLATVADPKHWSSATILTGSDRTSAVTAIGATPDVSRSPPATAAASLPAEPPIVKAAEPSVAAATTATATAVAAAAAMIPVFPDATSVDASAPPSRSARAEPHRTPTKQSASAISSAAATAAPAALDSSKPVAGTGEAGAGFDEEDDEEIDPDASTEIDKPKQKLVRPPSNGAAPAGAGGAPATTAVGVTISTSAPVTATAAAPQTPENKPRIGGGAGGKWANYNPPTADQLAKMDWADRIHAQAMHTEYKAAIAAAAANGGGSPAKLDTDLGASSNGPAVPWSPPAGLTEPEKEKLRHEHARLEMEKRKERRRAEQAAKRKGGPGTPENDPNARPPIDAAAIAAAQIAAQQLQAQQQREREAAIARQLAAEAARRDEQLLAQQRAIEEEQAREEAALMAATAAQAQSMALIAQKQNETFKQLEQQNPPPPTAATPANVNSPTRPVTQPPVALPQPQALPAPATPQAARAIRIANGDDDDHVDEEDPNGADEPADATASPPRDANGALLDSADTASSPIVIAPKTNRGVLTIKSNTTIIGPVYGTHAAPAATPAAPVAATTGTVAASATAPNPISPALARPVGTAATVVAPPSGPNSPQSKAAAAAAAANPLLPDAQRAAAASAANWKAVPTVKSTKAHVSLTGGTALSAAVPSGASVVDVANAFYRVARLGAAFIKHGRRGAPHERTVVVSQLSTKSLKIDWGSGYMLLTKGDAKIVDGKVTEPFKRPAASKAKDSDCFSIMTAARTLDLQVVEKTGKGTRDFWVNGLRAAIDNFDA